MRQRNPLFKDKKLKSKLASQVKNAFAEADASPKCFVSTKDLHKYGTSVKKNEAIYYLGDDPYVLRFKKDLQNLKEG